MTIAVAPANHIGQQAAEHARIRETCVHALPTRRAVNVRGITDQKQSPVAIVISYTVMQAKARTPMHL